MFGQIKIIGRSIIIGSGADLSVGVLKMYLLKVKLQYKGHNSESYIIGVMPLVY